MISTPIELEKLLNDREDEHLECKEAKNQYDFKKLVRYCVALANEGGGKIVLGVTDKLPRRIVGTKAYLSPQKIKSTLVELLHLRLTSMKFTHLMAGFLSFQFLLDLREYLFNVKVVIG